MLRVKLEFYKGILFVRFKGILDKNNIKETDLNNILEELGFKMVVFNINDIKAIDSYGIKFLINYNTKLKKYNGKAIVCQNNKEFIDKFIPKIKFIKKEKEVFNTV